MQLANGNPKYDITALTYSDVTEKIEKEFVDFEGGIKLVKLDLEQGTLEEDMKTKFTTEE